MYERVVRYLGILVVGGGLHYSFRAIRGVVALEDTRTDKHTCSGVVMASILVCTAAVSAKEKTDKKRQRENEASQVYQGYTFRAH